MSKTESTVTAKMNTAKMDCVSCSPGHALLGVRGQRSFWARSVGGEPLTQILLLMYLETSQRWLGADDAIKHAPT